MSEPLYILGAGSLGLLWAARCARAGIDCRLILRNPQALADWRRQGSRVLLQEQGRVSAIAVPGELATTSQQPIHSLVVATKAWATVEALEGLATRLREHSQVLLLQNGLGSQQAVSQGFPAQRVLYASVTDGAWKRTANHVVWAGTGQTLIGDPDQQPAPAWLEQLTRAGIDWQWQTDILSVLWLKLAINCAINPFSGLYDCPNGEVPAHAGAAFEPLLSELHALLVSQNISLSRAELEQRVLGVIHATAANSSSMRQDLHAGRRTEIDFILGYSYRSARQAGLTTPALDLLYHRLQTRLAELGLPQN